MTWHVRLGLAFVLPAISGWSADAPAESAIRQLVSEYARAENSGDSTGAARLFTPDAEIRLPDGRVLRGVPEIEGAGRDLRPAADEPRPPWSERRPPSYRNVTIRFIRPDVAVADVDRIVDGGRSSHVLFLMSQWRGRWAISGCWHTPGLSRN